MRKLINIELSSPKVYLSDGYAKSLADFGQPRKLLHSGGGWIQRRFASSQIPDGMGLYPLLCCEDWSALETDLNDLADQIISFVAVLDPYGCYDTDFLKKVFPGVFRPFKKHFAVNLSRPLLLSAIADNHKRNIRKADAKLSIDWMYAACDWSSEWCGLYGNLIQRHNIQGPAAFSAVSLTKQIALPGMMAFRAMLGGQTVGMQLWARHGDVACYHLAAYDQAGYDNRASYALTWQALRYWQSEGMAWAHLGGGGGLNDATDGLTRFKAGWSDTEKTAWIAGRICHPKEYERLLLTSSRGGATFFPGYRSK